MIHACAGVLVLSWSHFSEFGCCSVTAFECGFLRGTLELSVVCDRVIWHIVENARGSTLTTKSSGEEEWQLQGKVTNLTSCLLLFRVLAPPGIFLPSDGFVLSLDLRDVCTIWLALLRGHLGLCFLLFVSSFFLFVLYELGSPSNNHFSFSWRWLEHLASPTEGAALQA
jgi:hypothetical protein